MTRNEQLEFCKKCVNKRFSSKDGIICGLTNKPADFDGECKDYIPNNNSTEDSNIEDQTDEVVNESFVLDETTILKLKSHQDFYYAVVGGLLATLVSAVIWAAITVGTQTQIGYMAIGVGLLVGYSVRFFGAGIDKKFGYLAAGLSLLGCILGNLLSQVGFIASQESLGYFETISYLNIGLIIAILTESFDPIDLLFYGLAIYGGYKFAFRKITHDVIASLSNDASIKDSANYKLRMPLVIISIVLLTFVAIRVSLGYSGHKTYTSETGKIAAQGELLRSKQHGIWTYYYENGNKQSEGFYKYGSRDSLWRWYREDGSLEAIGSYKNGLDNGVYISFYENGIMSDSGSYKNTRMEGLWKYWYENGNIKSVVHYLNGKPDNTIIVYYENGNKESETFYKEGNPYGISTTYFENGQLYEEISYNETGQSSVLNIFDKNGVQLVKEGNGIYKSFDTNGLTRQEGTIENGQKIGVWISYHENGIKSEEGTIESGTYQVLNSWDKDGNPMVLNGSGLYKSYLNGDTIIIESGTYENGYRSGSWNLFYPNGEIYQEKHFQNGKLHGLQTFYYSNGYIELVGEMIDDMKDGNWVWFYPTGGISSTVSYVKDKKEGKQVLWDVNGKKVREEHYKGGILVKEKQLR